MVDINNSNSINSTTLSSNNNFEHQAVVMFGDISGYSNLCNALRNNQMDASERIAFLINGYLDQLCKIVMKQGGDIFKFAGDAIIVLFILNDTSHEPPGEHIINQCLRRVIQCSLEIQEKLHQTKLTRDVTLSIKLGISMGQINIINIGGIFSRYEQVPTGQPLLEAFECEGACEQGDIHVTKRIQDLMKVQFKFENSKNLYKPKQIYKNSDQLPAINFSIIKKTNMSNNYLMNIKSELEKFVPNAATMYIKQNLDKFVNQLRKITVLFVSLGIDLKQIKSSELNIIFQKIQKITYKQFGSINKFLMDDKGSTLILCFGLPKTAKIDDCERAIFCSIDLCEQFSSINKSIQIGATTGINQCGIVGTSGSRREQSILGEATNLAARHMCRAKELKINGKLPQNCHPIVIDQNLMIESCHKVSQLKLDAQIPKGYTDKIVCYTPNYLEYLNTGVESLKLLKFSYATHEKEINLIDRTDESREIKSILDSFQNNKLSSKNLMQNIQGNSCSGKSSLVYKIMTEQESKQPKSKIYTNMINPGMYQSLDKIKIVKQSCFQICQYQIIQQDNFDKVLDIKERQNLINSLDQNEYEDLIIQNLNREQYPHKILILDDFQYMDPESGNLLIKILNQTKNTLIIILNTTDENGQIINKDINFTMAKITFDSIDRSGKNANYYFKDMFLSNNLNFNTVKQMIKSECTKHSSANKSKNNPTKIGQLIKNKLTKYSNNWWQNDEINESNSNNSRKIETNEYLDLENRLVNYVVELSHVSAHSAIQFVNELIIDNMLKIDNIGSLVFSKFLRETLILENQCKLTLPPQVQSKQLMKVDNLINEIIELKTKQGIEHFEFDPTYIVILQTASIIGMNFNIKTLTNLLPIDISENKLLEFLLDLSELNIILEQHKNSEYAFESSFMKDVIQNTTLYDFRKKMHRRQAALRTIEMDVPPKHVLIDSEKLNMFNSQQKIDLRWQQIFSKQTNQNEQFESDQNQNEQNIKIGIISDEHIINAVTTKDILQKINQKTDGQNILWKEVMQKDSSQQQFGTSFSKEERLICLNESSLFQCQEKSHQTDEMLWNQRLGMIPFDAIDNLQWQVDSDFYQVKLTAKYWYKKRELNHNSRTFLFGANDLKLAQEFQSALQFLMFNLKYDIFSEKFGKIKFPLDKEHQEKSLNQMNLNNQLSKNYMTRLSIGSRLSNASRRMSLDHRISTFNQSLNTSEHQDADFNKEYKDDVCTIIEMSQALFVHQLVEQSVKPTLNKQNRNKKNLINKLNDHNAVFMLNNPSKIFKQFYQNMLMCEDTSNFNLEVNNVNLNYRQSKRISHISTTDQNDKNYMEEIKRDSKSKNNINDNQLKINHNKKLIYSIDTSKKSIKKSRKSSILKFRQHRARLSSIIKNSNHNKSKDESFISIDFSNSVVDNNDFQNSVINDESALDFKIGIKDNVNNSDSIEVEHNNKSRKDIKQLIQNTDKKIDNDHKDNDIYLNSNQNDSLLNESEGNYNFVTAKNTLKNDNSNNPLQNININENMQTNDVNNSILSLASLEKDLNFVPNGRHYTFQDNIDKVSVSSFCDNHNDNNNQNNDNSNVNLNNNQSIENPLNYNNININNINNYDLSSNPNVNQPIKNYTKIKNVMNFSDVYQLHELLLKYESVLNPDKFKEMIAIQLNETKLEILDAIRDQNKNYQNKIKHKLNNNYKNNIPSNESNENEFIIDNNSNNVEKTLKIKNEQLLNENKLLKMQVRDLLNKQQMSSNNDNLNNNNQNLFNEQDDNLNLEIKKVRENSPLKKFNKK